MLIPSFSLFLFFSCPPNEILYWPPSPHQLRRDLYHGSSGHCLVGFRHSLPTVRSLSFSFCVFGGYDRLEIFFWDWIWVFVLGKDWFLVGVDVIMLSLEFFICFVVIRRGNFWKKDGIFSGSTYVFFYCFVSSCLELSYIQ